MKESTYVYVCDWNQYGDRCGERSDPVSDYYARPVGWSEFSAKTESEKTAGPFHFCPSHTDYMFAEIVSDLAPGHPNPREETIEQKR